MIKTNSTLEIKNTVDQIESTYNKDEYLQKFQYNIKEYLIKSDTRGLLLFHSPGTGKSITAAAIAEYYRIHDPKRRIVILSSKSLQNNFKGNIRKYMFQESLFRGPKNKDSINNIIETKYNFISLNASNMFKQVSSIGKSQEEIDYEKSLEKFNDYIGGNKSFLENSLLIIDEVHNLSNAIKNGSKNGIKLYDTIMKTKNIKLIFLTGTPVVSSPFEIVPLFNMLKGFIYHLGNKYTLFPENLQEFYNIFIDKEKSSIKNANVFKNRIIGMVSYYGNFYFQGKIKENFPEEKPLIIEKVAMSSQQFIKYQDARSIEEKESAGSFTKPSFGQGFFFKDDSGSSSSYRIRSRQESNYCIPEYAIKKVHTKGEKGQTKIVTQKFIHKIEKDDLKNLDRFSPKFKKIIDNVKSHPNQLSVVYSEFVHANGIILFSLVLEAAENYVYWRDMQINKDATEVNEYDLEILDKIVKKDKTSKNIKSTKLTKRSYALIHGDVPFSERESILKTFNDKKNITGDYISLLLISKSGAEGLNLKNVRNIHIMEPFWNFARIEQVIARGARFMSHMFLPKDLQNIQPYLYISTYPSDFKRDPKKELERTTDEELLYVSIVGKKLINQFELALIESSVDCSINKKDLSPDIQKQIDCHLCLPNNKNLFDTDINTDLKIDNCQPLNTSEIDAKQIKIDNVVYYYTYDKDTNKIKIYEYNDKIGNYIEMAKNNPLFSQIVINILKF